MNYLKNQLDEINMGNKENTMKKLKKLWKKFVTKIKGLIAKIKGV